MLEGVVTFMTAEAYMWEAEEAEGSGRKQERAAIHRGQASFPVSPSATYRSTPPGTRKVAPPAGDLPLRPVSLRGHVTGILFAVLCLTVSEPVMAEDASLTVGTCGGRNGTLRSVSTTPSKQRDHTKRCDAINLQNSPPMAYFL